MTFTPSPPVYNSVPGDARLCAIPFANGGADTGGTFTTPFKTIIGAWIQVHGTIAAANMPRITSPTQAQLPFVGSQITMVTDLDVDGVLYVLGR
jgi:hypothetical protein